MANVEDLISRPHVCACDEGDGFRDEYRHVAGAPPVRGNLVPDAHLVALTRPHGSRPSGATIGISSSSPGSRSAAPSPEPTASGTPPDRRRGPAGREGRAQSAADRWVASAIERTTNRSPDTATTVTLVK
jgi:hypothetical protein